MIDQRRRESLGRFLVRRAMKRAKEGGDQAEQLPVNFYRSIRWRFRLEKRYLMLHAGLFGIQAYWGAVCDVINNVSEYEKRWGIIFYPIFRVFPGMQPRIFTWLKSKAIEG